MVRKHPRRNRLTLEALEGRELLSGVPGSTQAAQQLVTTLPAVQQGSLQGTTAGHQPTNGGASGIIAILIG